MIFLWSKPLYRWFPVFTFLSFKNLIKLFSFLFFLPNCKTVPVTTKILSLIYFHSYSILSYVSSVVGALLICSYFSFIPYSPFFVNLQGIYVPSFLTLLSLFIVNFPIFISAITRLWSESAFVPLYVQTFCIIYLFLNCDQSGLYIHNMCIEYIYQKWRAT